MRPNNNNNMNMCCLNCDVFSGCNSLYCVTVGQSGQTYCVTVKDECEPRTLHTVSLSNMPLTTTNSSVIQYTPSADGQFFIPGMIHPISFIWEFDYHSEFGVLTSGTLSLSLNLAGFLFSFWHVNRCECRQLISTDNHRPFISMSVHHCLQHGECDVLHRWVDLRQLRLVK